MLLDNGALREGMSAAEAAASYGALANPDTIPDMSQMTDPEWTGDG